LTHGSYRALTFYTLVRGLLISDKAYGDFFVYYSSKKALFSSRATLYGGALQLQHRVYVYKTKEKRHDASQKCIEYLTSHLVSVSQRAGPSVSGSVLVIWVTLVPQVPLSTGGSSAM